MCIFREMASQFFVRVLEKWTLILKNKENTLKTARCAAVYTKGESQKEGFIWN